MNLIKNMNRISLYCQNVGIIDLNIIFCVKGLILTKRYNI